MSINENVNIKGTKDGLIFLLNEDCSFEEVLDELRNKLENSHQGILTGPVMRVTIKTGYRNLSSDQKDILRNVFKTKGNLFVHTIENEIELMKTQLEDNVKVITRTIRSGQNLKFEGNVLLLGGINPGGNLLATGDIYIIGALRGGAHAGFSGDENAIVAASIMTPTQIRIASYLTVKPLEKEIDDTNNKFAYVKDNQIYFESVQHISKYRKSFGNLFRRS